MAESAGVFLRRQRLQAGLSQQLLATRAGLAVRTVRDIERGSVCHPHTSSLSALAVALGLSESEFVEFREALAASTRQEIPSVGVLGTLTVTRAGGTVVIGPP